MVAKSQLWLPKFGNVKRVKRKRKPPQPKTEIGGKVKKFELIHRPFDLRFRGRINRWLEYIRSKKNIEVEKVLDEFQKKIVRLYFYPQEEKRWLNQEQVIRKIRLNSKKKLKKMMVNSLLQIWEKVKTQ